ncbi:hypothetical protein PoB_003438300 [Plakobranchus ocellatus]|uniref:Uncharacterized protein n=1 Tax=Plakobranchus ocellatus TaxID=259542 RepID=A0AAV4AM60_9GAST|nr:hypothetical protein PoB_003438300 [Plakobranchus ocellatus]
MYDRHAFRERDNANEVEDNSNNEKVTFGHLSMARHDWFHPGLYLFLILAISLSMLSISDGQENPVFMFHPYTIEFTQERLERFLGCLCTARTSTCRQNYSLTRRALYYTAQGNARRGNILASEEISNTFRCYPGAFTKTKAFIYCERSSDPSDECDNKQSCYPHTVRPEYDECNFKCINIWWGNFTFSTKHFVGYPEIIPGSCEPSGNSPSIDNTHPGNEDKSDDTDSTGLMVAAALGWLFFALLSGSVLAFLYCWKCRTTFVISRRNQSGQKFVASRNCSLPNTYGNHQPTSQHGRENVNKNNGQKTGYTDYNETNDDYTVIDDEKMPSVKKGNVKTNDAKPKNKRVLPHSPYSTVEPNEISEGNSQTSKNGHLPKTITGGDVSHRNKLSTEAADAYSRLQTGRLAADPQMTKSVMLTYNRPSDTVSINDQGSIDPERPGAVNGSVHPYNLASAVHDEQDESASHHYKSPPARTAQAL